MPLRSAVMQGVLCAEGGLSSPEEILSVLPRPLDFIRAKR